MFVYVLLRTDGMNQPTMRVYQSRNGAMMAVQETNEWRSQDDRSYEAQCGQTFFQIEKLEVLE